MEVYNENHLPPIFAALLCRSQLNGKCTKDVSLVFTSKTRDKWDTTKTTGKEWNSRKMAKSLRVLV